MCCCSSMLHISFCILHLQVHCSLFIYYCYNDCSLSFCQNTLQDLIQYIIYVYILHTVKSMSGSFSILRIIVSILFFRTYPLWISLFTKVVFIYLCSAIIHYRSGSSRSTKYFPSILQSVFWVLHLKYCCLTIICHYCIILWKSFTLQPIFNSVSVLLFFSASLIILNPSSPIFQTIHF